MSWVVDTSVLLDVHLADPVFSRASAECLAKHVVAGLVVSPVTYIELAPAFDGDADLQEQFLAEVGVEWPALWTLRIRKQRTICGPLTFERDIAAAPQNARLPTYSSRRLPSALKGSLREIQGIL